MNEGYYDKDPYKSSDEAKKWLENCSKEVEQILSTVKSVLSKDEMTEFLKDLGLVAEE